MKPAGSGGRLNDERRLAQADEADRRDFVKAAWRRSLRQLGLGDGDADHARLLNATTFAPSPMSQLA